MGGCLRLSAVCADVPLHSSHLCPVSFSYRLTYTPPHTLRLYTSVLLNTWAENVCDGARCAVRCPGLATQLTELHSDKSRLRESFLADGGASAGSGAAGGADSTTGGGGKEKTGVGVSPAVDNVDRQLAYLVAQNQVQHLAAGRKDMRRNRRATYSSSAFFFCGSDGLFCCVKAIGVCLVLAVCVFAMFGGGSSPV